MLICTGIILEFVPFCPVEVNLTKVDSSFMTFGFIVLLSLVYSENHHKAQSSTCKLNQSQFTWLEALHISLVYMMIYYQYEDRNQCNLLYWLLNYCAAHQFWTEMPKAKVA